MEKKTVRVGTIAHYAPGRSLMLSLATHAVLGAQLQAPEPVKFKVGQPQQQGKITRQQRRARERSDAKKKKG